MPGQDFIVVSDSAPVVVALEPAQNAFHSLMLLLKADKVSGFGDWVTRTALSLAPQERERHLLVMIGFYYAILPAQSWASFPTYLDYLASCDPLDLRQKMLTTYSRVRPPTPDGKPVCFGDPQPTDWNAVLQDADSYLSFLRERFGGELLDVELETRAYGYVVDPAAMQELIVAHLRRMWDQYLAPEWKRAEPMLCDAVEACRQLDLRGMTRLQAVEAITDQEVDEKLQLMLEEAERVFLVPSAHVGPYLGRVWVDGTLWLLYGARLPAGLQIHAPDLSRAEIVMRLGALADDVRLGILKLIADQGELRSQDVMEQMDLSQSAASRHLKQLSATGCLFERRCEGAKCYRLNPDRIRATLAAASRFLLGE